MKEAKSGNAWNSFTKLGKKLSLHQKLEKQDKNVHPQSDTNLPKQE